MNIYIGNMSFDTTEDNLLEAFKAFGEVSTVKVIMDNDTSRPKGFAFIEMPSKDEAQAAISGLNGTELSGRTLNVSEAKSKSEKSGNRSGGNGYRKVY